VLLKLADTAFARLMLNALEQHVNV